MLMLCIMQGMTGRKKVTSKHSKKKKKKRGWGKKIGEQKKLRGKELEGNEGSGIMALSSHPFTSSVSPGLRLLMCLLKKRKMVTAPASRAEFESYCAPFQCPL